MIRYQESLVPKRRDTCQMQLNSNYSPCPRCSGAMITYVPYCNHGEPDGCRRNVSISYCSLQSIRTAQSGILHDQARSIVICPFIGRHTRRLYPNREPITTYTFSATRVPGAVNTILSQDRKAEMLGRKRKEDMISIDIRGTRCIRDTAPICEFKAFWFLGHNKRTQDNRVNNHAFQPQANVRGRREQMIVHVGYLLFPQRRGGSAQKTCLGTQGASPCGCLAPLSRYGLAALCPRHIPRLLSADNLGFGLHLRAPMCAGTLRPSGP